MIRANDLSLAHIIRLCKVREFFKEFLVLGIKGAMQFSCKRYELCIIAAYAIFRNKFEHIV